MTPSIKLIFLLLVGILILFPKRSIAQWNSVGNIDRFREFKDGIEISAGPAKIRISVVSLEIIRVRMSPTGTFGPEDSWAVVDTNIGSRAHEVDDSPDAITLKTSAVMVRVQKRPCRISFYDAKGNLINEDDPTKGMGWAGNEVAVWKTMPQNEFYFGFGEKSGELPRKWKAMSMWNSDIPGYRADTDPLYETIPFFYGVKKDVTYGIFFDNTYYSFYDMGKENPGQYSFGAIDGELNYYFFYGPKPKDVLSRFSTLTGKMPLPPQWAVAYQQCRYSYYPESRVREIADTFRKKKIPCDVIYLDIHYMDGYRCFTWDKQRFPDPKKMVGDLAKDGFKMVVIIDPGIKNEKGYWVYDEGVKGDYFAKYPDGKYFVGKVWPGECVFPDFTSKASREWWGTLYKGLVDVGIKGFWNDMNEPAVFDVPTKTFDLTVMHDDNGQRTDHRKNHNVYGMQMARGTFEGAVKLRPNERPFVLTRANYAGGHRYAAAWTGDNISSWDHLEMAVPMCLNLSISGQPFVGTDIGGFVGSPSGELYARWLQLGVFTPLMRTHTEIGSKDQEPWSYGPEFEAINRKSIELRYKLLPYIYTQFYLASKTGIPMMRPLVFDYPEEQSTYWNSRDFLFGDALLVAPVLWAGETTRDVRLPAGEWYDYWTNEKYTGPKQVRVDAPVDRIPLFVKAGSIVPTRQVVQYSDESPVDPLTLEIFPGADGSAKLYEDDGLSFKYQKGEYSLREISCSSEERAMNVVLSKPEGSYRSPKRSVVLKIMGVEKPTKVTLDGKSVSSTVTENLNKSSGGWAYEEQSHTLRVRFGDSFGEQTVGIRW